MEQYNLDKTGQHYMIDKSLIRYIASEAMLLPDDVVLEIGAGHGELTREIAKKCKVIAVDIEENGISVKNMTFVKGNILDLILGLQKKYGFNKIVANIPYSISEPLMRKIFKIDVELVLIVVGKNFSQILSSKDTRIGVITSELYDIEILKRIPAKSFRPQPRVESALVSLSQRDIDIVDKPAVIYKELVMLDDKKLRNSLLKMFPGTKKELKGRLSAKIFDKSLYQLSNKEFMKLDAFLRDAGK